MSKFNDDFDIVDILTLEDRKIVYLDRHWICLEGDPTKALVYNGSPQCHSNYDIALRLSKHYSQQYNIICSPVFVKIAYLRK